MEQNHSAVSMIQMFTYPVFLVKDGVVAHKNQAAQQLKFPDNIPVCELLTGGADIYRSMTAGCLSLTLSIHNTDFLATVIRMEDFDIFHLESCKSESSGLYTLALAASQLRQPLSEVTTVSELMLTNASQQQRDLYGHLNRALMRLLRMMGNMSDAQDYADRTYRMEMLDATAVIREALESAQAKLSDTGRTLTFNQTGASMSTWADRTMLERAVYNLISNAVKFSPADSTIRVSLETQNNRLSLRVENICTHMTPELLSTMFFRYKRHPAIESGEHGIGLGLPLIRSVAAAHGGTLLADQPEKDTIRFTLTISKRQPDRVVVSVPRISVDTEGGRNNCLLELSDVLKPKQYQD